MLKDKWIMIRDFVIRNYKIVFPVIVVVVVAVTVAAALNLNRGEASAQDGSGDAPQGTVSTAGPEGQETADQTTEGQTADGQTAEGQVTEEQTQEVPLVENQDSEIYTLVATYFNAKGTGDMDTLVSLYDEVPEKDLLRYEETAKYLDRYTTLQVFCKDGPVADSVIAYVYYRVCFVDRTEEFPGYENLYICRNDQGELYIKNEVNFTQEEKDYITKINGQDDVVEFNNKVTVEYNDLLLQDPSLLDYLNELGRQVDASIGVAIAEQNVDAGQQEQDAAQEGADGQTPPQEENPEPQEPVQQATPQYATATTTVNVRSSDSEQADKLGKVSSGTRLQVQEVSVNGWTKVIYEGADGYIKSEYLQFEESAGDQEVIGSVTATTSINIRAAASETADRLGLLAGGESLDLLAVEGDWCKVVYNGRTAYVKAEYVEQH